MRLLDNKLAQGNPAAPERIDAQPSLHFLRREEWFRTGRLFSMDHQTLMVACMANQRIDKERNSTLPPVAFSNRLTSRRVSNGLPAPLPKNIATPVTITTIFAPRTHATSRSQRHFRPRVLCVTLTLHPGESRRAGTACPPSA